MFSNKIKLIKILIFQKTRHGEAEHWFTKANEIAPEDPNVHMHYGFFLLDTERNLEAGIQFEKAVQIRPQDYESNFNAGVAFRLAGKNDLAEKFYRQALQLRPQVRLIFFQHCNKRLTRYCKVLGKLDRFANETKTIF